MVLITSLILELLYKDLWRVISRYFIFNDAVIHLLHPSRTDLEIWKHCESHVCHSSGAHSPEGTRWRTWMWIITTPHGSTPCVCCDHLQCLVLHIFLLLLCYCHRSVVLCRMTGGMRQVSKIYFKYTYIKNYLPHDHQNSV